MFDLIMIVLFFSIFIVNKKSIKVVLGAMIVVFILRSICG